MGWWLIALIPWWGWLGEPWSSQSEELAMSHHMDVHTLRWWCDLLANHFRNLGVDKTSHLNHTDSRKKWAKLASWWLNLLASGTSSGHGLMIPNGNGQLNLAVAVMVSFQYQVYELMSRREWILDDSHRKNSENNVPSPVVVCVHTCRNHNR